MSIALLFPGQGSQKPGMGKELAQEFSAAKDVFAEANEVLGFDLSSLCFEGPAEELNLTCNSQPAILATSIAALRALEAEKGPLPYDVAAGHSLGEWSALVAVGALSLADALRLVRIRGNAMQEAVPVGEGAMAAIMGMDADAVNALCNEAQQGEVCAPANYNAAGQIVISGSRQAVERAIQAAKAQKARAIPLAVSAPFHCSLMAPAAKQVEAALADIEVRPLSVPVVTNVEAVANQDAERVKELLVRQVTGAVRWQESVETMVASGFDKAFELGHGSVLKGLLRRIAKDVSVTCIGNPADIRNV